MGKLVYSLIGLAILDIILTRLILLNGGYEGNPFMVYAIETWWGIGLKILLTALLGYFIATRKIKKNVKLQVKPKTALIICNLLMLLVCYYNYVNLMLIIFFKPYG